MNLPHNSKTAVKTTVLLLVVLLLGIAVGFLFSPAVVGPVAPLWMVVLALLAVMGLPFGIILAGVAFWINFVESFRNGFRY
jgi:hypothetical protein